MHFTDASSLFLIDILNETLPDHSEAYTICLQYG